MSTRTRDIPAVLATLAAAASCVVADPVTFTPLGDLPTGQFWSEARAVSDQGAVYGDGSVESAFEFDRLKRAFVWREATGMQELTVPGRVLMGVHDVSADEATIFVRHVDVWVFNYRLARLDVPSGNLFDLNGGRNGSPFVGDGDFIRNFSCSADGSVWAYDRYSGGGVFPSQQIFRNGTLLFSGSFGKGQGTTFTLGRLSPSGRWLVASRTQDFPSIYFRNNQIIRFDNTTPSQVCWSNVNELTTQFTALAALNSGRVSVVRTTYGVGGFRSDALYECDGSQITVPLYSIRFTSSDSSVLAGTSIIQRPNVTPTDVRSYLIFKGASDVAGWSGLVITDISANGRYLVGYGSSPRGTEAFRVDFGTQPAPACDSADFNRDFLDSQQDIIDFFDVLAGAPCPYAPPCDIDINNNMVYPEDQDVLDFLNVFAGGTCGS